MATIQNPQDQNGINLINQETLNTEITRLEAADSALLTNINNEINRANIAEEKLDERITSIEGTIDYNTLSEQPSNAVQWTAMEFAQGEILNNIINKEIRTISISVTNTVDTPHFLGIFDTRTTGKKIVLGISKATTWNAGETAIFKFNSPIIIPGKFEIFLLNEANVGDSNGDLPRPDVYIQSYALRNGTQNYRIPEGTWASSNKCSFYLTFNFVDDRITKITEIVADHLIDNERHTTSNERNNWNGHLGNNVIHVTSSDKEKWNKASTDSNEALTTIQRYISTDGVLTPTSESVTLSDTTNVVFNLSNDDNIILISYVPYITADIDSTVSINNNQITFTLSKKDTTQIGENYFVLEVVYIDKNLKQVKRAFSCITVTIE